MNGYILCPSSSWGRTGFVTILYNQIILNITVRPCLSDVLLRSRPSRSVQLPREGEQAVNINTKVNEIIKSSSALPSVKTGGRQKNKPLQSFGCKGFVILLRCSSS